MLRRAALRWLRTSVSQPTMRAVVTSGYSMASESAETVSAVHLLKQKIEELTRDQAEALKTATYVGMRGQEGLAYDQRRKQITALMQELKAILQTR